jgi:hypothetical protein
MIAAMLLPLLLASLTVQEPDAPQAAAAPEVQRGLRKNEARASPGYVLFSPLRSRTTFLIDVRGETVHTWESPHPPIQVDIRDDGTLVRTGRIEDNPVFHGPGTCGRIQHLAKDGAVLWDYVLSDEKNSLHHGFDVMPNGNLLCIAWERLTRDEALALGRDPAVVSETGLWSDWIFELRPTPPSGGEIVWEWHAKDHLVQDFDPEKPNHGSIAAHPGRIDLNGDHRSTPPLTAEQLAELAELQEEMRALGYAGGEEPAAADATAAAAADTPQRHDWLHTNSVDYEPASDLILLSVPAMCEIWIIDHSTTSAEARGSSGGRWKHGGDLLYRWGNPAMYGMGTAADRQLFFQHQPEWIVPGLAGAGHVLVFNNGRERAPKEYSSIDELELPFDRARGFVREPDAPFGPAAPLWSYFDPESFYSFFISGCQRLPGGNTFVCQGKQGRFFEVTPAGEIVWEYWNPYGGELNLERRRGDTLGGGPSPVEATSCFRARKLAPDHPALRALGIVE